MNHNQINYKDCICISLNFANKKDMTKITIIKLKWIDGKAVSFRPEILTDTAANMLLSQHKKSTTPMYIEENEIKKYFDEEEKTPGTAAAKRTRPVRYNIETEPELKPVKIMTKEQKDKIEASNGEEKS